MLAKKTNGGWKVRRGGWELTERRTGGNESFVQRKRSGGWEVTDRLYEGNIVEYG